MLLLPRTIALNFERNANARCLLYNVSISIWILILDKLLSIDFKTAPSGFGLSKVSSFVTVFLLCSCVSCLFSRQSTWSEFSTVYEEQQADQAVWNNNLPQLNCWNLVHTVCFYISLSTVLWENILLLYSPLYVSLAI